MKPTLKSLAAAGGLATALLASSATLADKWNMPVRSNERNYFTRNIMQFAEDVKKTTDGKVEIVIHPETSLTKQPEVKRAVQTGQVQIGELLMSMHSNERRSSASTRCRSSRRPARKGQAAQGDAPDRWRSV